MACTTARGVEFAGNSFDDHDKRYGMPDDGAADGGDDGGDDAAGPAAGPAAAAAPPSIPILDAKDLRTKRFKWAPQDGNSYVLDCAVDKTPFLEYKELLYRYMPLEPSNTHGIVLLAIDYYDTDEVVGSGISCDYFLISRGSVVKTDNYEYRFRSYGGVAHACDDVNFHTTSTFPRFDVVLYIDGGPTTALANMLYEVRIGQNAGGVPSYQVQAYKRNYIEGSEKKRLKIPVWGRPATALSSLDVIAGGGSLHDVPGCDITHFQIPITELRYGSGKSLFTEETLKTAYKPRVQIRLTLSWFTSAVGVVESKYSYMLFYAKTASGSMINNKAVLCEMRRLDQAVTWMWPSVTAEKTITRKVNPPGYAWYQVITTDVVVTASMMLGARLPAGI